MAVVDIRDSDVEYHLPLSALQEELLLHKITLGDGRDPYVIQLIFRIERALDRGRLKQAVRRLMVLHPCLRTSFIWDRGDSPAQAVHRTGELHWEEVDISPEQAAKQAEVAASITGFID